MKIIAGVERRRRWRCEEKLRIVTEVERPGASFNAVARRHEVSRGLLWSWRRQVYEGVLAPKPMPVFVPVRVATDVPSQNGPGCAPLGHVGPGSRPPPHRQLSGRKHALTKVLPIIRLTTTTTHHRLRPLPETYASYHDPMPGEIIRLQPELLGSKRESGVHPEL